MHSSGVFLDKLYLFGGIPSTNYTEYLIPSVDSNWTNGFNLQTRYLSSGCAVAISSDEVVTIVPGEGTGLTHRYNVTTGTLTDSYPAPPTEV